MCEPATILAIGGALVGAAGSIQQGKAASAAANYNAQIAAMNSKISMENAHDSVVRGQQEEQQHRQKVAQLKGQQTASMAANGIDVGFGSAMDTLVDTATMGELDALTIRENSAREANAHRQQAANQSASAELNRMNASASKTSGYFNAAGTLLTGAGNAYKSWSTNRGK